MPFEKALRASTMHRHDYELRFQVIGFRWAENLREYKSEETNRFVGYYESIGLILFGSSRCPASGGELTGLDL